LYLNVYLFLDDSITYLQITSINCNYIYLYFFFQSILYSAQTVIFGIAMTTSVEYLGDKPEFI